jgi:hypothetical protein
MLLAAILPTSERQTETEIFSVPSNYCARERDDREFASVLMVLSGFHEEKELLYV